ASEADGWIAKSAPVIRGIFCFPARSSQWQTAKWQRSPALLGRDCRLGDRYFDQRVRECRRPSKIRVGAGAESVHRSFRSAQVAPISQGCDNNPLHDLSAHLCNCFEAAAIVKDPYSASLADVPCDCIFWIDKHDLLACVMQLSRQIAIAGIEECVTLRRDDVEGVFRRQSRVGRRRLSWWNIGW